MDENEIFLENLLDAMNAAGMSEAELSRAAGLNPRAVTDIRERRTRSPKLSTVFALARAVNRDPAEFMGLGPRPRLSIGLIALLEQYSEGEQEQLVRALALLPPHPA